MLLRIHVYKSSIRPAVLLCFLPGNYLERLQCMSIDHQNIDSLDGIAQLAATCPNLRDIDISHNLLTSWTEVSGSVWFIFVLDYSVVLSFTS